MKINISALLNQVIHYDLTAINRIYICFRNGNIIITVYIRLHRNFGLIYPVISSCLI